MDHKEIMQQYTALFLVEPEALAKELEENPDGLKILDASYSLSNIPDDDVAKEHIGNAIFFDIDEIADPVAPLAHTLPNAEQFAESVASLGLSNNDRIVIYDQSGIFMAACRAWWMFKVFGHDDVRVLNGGLPAWKNAGLPVHTDTPESLVPGKYEVSTVHREMVVDKEAVLQTTEQTQKNTIVVDARPAARYRGEAPEPRPDMVAGHIPGSLNIPMGTFLEPETGKLKEPEVLRDILTGHGLNEDQQIISSCGSGITACVLALSCHVAGWDNVAVYDGSWAEWGQGDQNNPVACSG